MLEGMAESGSKKMRACTKDSAHKQVKMPGAERKASAMPSVPSFLHPVKDTETSRYFVGPVEQCLLGHHLSPLCVALLCAGLQTFRNLRSGQDEMDFLLRSFPSLLLVMFSMMNLVL